MSKLAIFYAQKSSASPAKKDQSLRKEKLSIPQLFVVILLETLLRTQVALQ
jgi:hypothetical protein